MSRILQLCYLQQVGSNVLLCWQPCPVCLTAASAVPASLGPWHVRLFGHVQRWGCAGTETLYLCATESGALRKIVWACLRC